MDAACSMTGEYEERVWVIDGKTGEKETTRKTKM
jgi:hypothetical protein